MTASELLAGAAAVVQRGWCQGRFARNEEGAMVDVRHRTAVCFCMMGALMYMDGQGNNHSPAYEIARQTILRVVKGDPTVWNDHPLRTKEDVIEALQTAAFIALEEGK